MKISRLGFLLLLLPNRGQAQGQRQPSLIGDSRAERGRNREIDLSRLFVVRDRPAEVRPTSNGGAFHPNASTAGAAVLMASSSAASRE